MEHEIRSRLEGEVRDGLMGRIARPDAEGHGGRVTNVRVGRGETGQRAWDVEVDVEFSGPGIDGHRATWHAVIRHRPDDQFALDDDTIWVDMRSP
jgi:hypothetical protein